MGKRKSSAKPPPKAPAPKLDTAFNCPFCNSTKTVTCTMDWEQQLGTVSCVVCRESWSSKINHLSGACVCVCARVRGGWGARVFD